MSEAEAVEAGNARYSGGSFVEWNTQFFIYSKQAIPVGKWIHLKFKVRGDVNAQGYFIGEDINGIEIGLDEDSFNENKIDFHVWNNPEAGISFADGNTVKTQLCISKAGWYYIYNITLMSQEAYEAAGISSVKASKTGNGMIYNLAGQRVDASYKGLVIKDGKKAIQK